MAAERCGTGPGVPEAAWPTRFQSSPAARAAFSAFHRAERTRVVAVVASLTGDRATAEDITTKSHLHRAKTALAGALRAAEGDR